MANKKFGKLSFGASENGVNFRWGENGETKQLNLGPLNKLFAGSGDGSMDDRYDDRGYDEDGVYEDVYDGDDRYGSYDNRRDDRYDDDYDDGYDDGYDDAYENNYDDRYDDRYQEPDDDEPYYEPGYAEEQGPSRLDVIWDFLDRYPWIIYVLLVVLPPLGIYLLWRQRMFDFTIRSAVSVVSGIWCVVMLFWLFSGMGGVSGDEQANPTQAINLTSPTATIAAEATANPLDNQTTVNEATSEPGADASVEPTPTALASQTNTGNTGDINAASSYVFSPTTGAYYHKTSTCSSIGTTAVTQVSLEIAESRNQSQCPTCYGSTVYYMTDGGKNYHSNPNCQDMKNAQSVTKTVATKAGKTACPECIREFYISSTSPYFHAKSNCSGITNASQTTINSAKAAGKTACPTCVGASIAGSATAAPSTDYSKPSNKYDAGVIVYAKPGGSNYHRSATCTGSGMSGGHKITLYNAIELGYTACKHCLADGNDTVYCDKSGDKYHSTNSCTAAKNVVKTSRGKALAVGADKCSKCWGAGTSSSTGSSSSASTASGPSVYITSENNYYHTRKACNGMDDPTKISLREAMNMGKSPCNDCAGQANNTVYAASGDSKYHYSSSCAKLKGKATKGTLAMALADELDPCSACVTNNNTSSGAGESGNEDGIVDHSGISVYITQYGSHYHSNTSCSELGAEEYFKVSLGVADAAEKSPCSKCCATASHKVYSSAQDKRYHFDKNCSLLPGTPKGATLARALMDGLKACPACTSDEGSQSTIQGTPAPEIVPMSESVSGKKVYVTKNGSRYHITKECTKITNQEIKGISLETAKNYSLTPCSTCSSIAKKTVYGNDVSKYYHSGKSCNGVANDTSGTLEAALLAGLKPCPICINGNESSNSGNENSNAGNNSSSGNNNNTGNTGNATSNGGSAEGSTKVYIDLANNSEIYHKTAKCSKLSNTGTGVTLQYVLDMGFKGCGHCNPPTSVAD